jgi:hypothetical protein
MHVMQAAVAKPLAARPAALKSLRAVPATELRLAELKSLLAILAEHPLATADAALESVMADCWASCSATRRVAMKSLAMLAHPQAARPATEHQLRLLQPLLLLLQPIRMHT